MNKEFLIILLEIWSMIFGGIAILINLVSIIIFALYSLVIPSIFLLVVVVPYTWIRYNELANDTYPKITSIRTMLAIISLIVVAVLVCYSFKVPMDYIMDKANKICNDNGLNDGCSDEDICRKNCLDLGKEYYKYEFSHGFFSGSISDCWCKIGDKTEQIW